VAGAPLRVGVAGLGTVGAALVSFCASSRVRARGAAVEVSGVSARSRSRPRPTAIDDLAWFDDPVALARAETTDSFVELIGGSDGPAKAAVEAALTAGKPVVTANKALLAEHGLELARLAESRGVPLLFEAAVMGGTPAVKMLREGLVGDDVASIAGILNGTCNFILSEMEAKGSPSPMCSPRRSGSATPSPTRRWTSEATTRPTRSCSWPRSRSAPRRTTPPPRSRGWRASRRSTSGWPATSAIASS
jgi:homoserine dehydrogenase